MTRLLLPVVIVNVIYYVHIQNINASIYIEVYFIDVYIDNYTSNRNVSSIFQ